MPAAAVIPIPLAFFCIAAVKKLVVGFFPIAWRVGVNNLDVLSERKFFRVKPDEVTLKKSNRLKNLYEGNSTASHRNIGLLSRDWL